MSSEQSAVSDDDSRSYIRNYRSSNGEAGAKANPNLYSLIETAKANGLNPYEYLKVVFRELPNAQSVETEPPHLKPPVISRQSYKMKVGTVVSGVRSDG